MPNPQTQTAQAQSLARLITQSEIISEQEKKEFLELLPSLSQKQIDDVTNFFLSAEKEIEQTNSAFREKQSRIYTEFVPKIHEAFDGAQKMIHSAELLGKFKNP